MHRIPDSLDGIPGYDKRQTGARVGRQENRARLGRGEVAVTYDMENSDDQLLFAEINLICFHGWIGKYMTIQVKAIKQFISVV